MRRTLLSLLVVLAAFAAPAAARATTIIVNTEAPEAPSPACGLKDAIAAVDSSNPVNGCPAGEVGVVDRIEFALPSPATISVSSPLEISEDVEIIGPGAGQLTVSGGHVSRVFEAQAGAISISGLTIADGMTSELGAGMYVQGPATVELERTVLQDNKVEVTSSAPPQTPEIAAGGAIFNEGHLTLTESSVTGNEAVNSAGAAEMRAFGGGIAIGEGEVVLDRSTVSGNAAIVSAGTMSSTARGGGIFNLSKLVLRASTVSGNRAEANNAPTNSAVGGGISFQQGPLPPETTIERSTIVENATVAESLSEGGGIAGLALPAAIRSSTIADNSAITGANVFDQAAVSFTSTIVARPRIGASCFGPTTSLGHNLDEGANCGFEGPTDQRNVDPRLGTLAANGGPTETLALESGSPAIDHGVAAFGESSDQRGFERPVEIPSVPNGPGSDGADVGAYEVQVPRVEITAGPRDGETITDAQPAFEFRADGSAGGFLCALDGGAPAPCSSPFKAPQLANGAHTFTVSALGEDGYAGPGSSRSFSVDVHSTPSQPSSTKAKAPQTKITGLPSRTTKRRLKIRFSANQAGATFQCKLDKGKWRGCRSPYKTPKLKLGKHVFKVKAKGPTGVVDQSPATKTFRVVAAS
ncbi:MAG TPA: choice-of-anchor Q domain-containing protein [Solirubrobacterales bacterium]|jgi:hypothetical protein